MKGFEKVSINTPRARSLIYGLLALASMVVFGNVAEICDYADRCPARFIWIIVVAVAAAILSLIMFAKTLAASTSLGLVETVSSFSLLVLFSVCAGLVSSVRTGLGNTPAVNFSWFSLVLSFVLLFASVTAEGGLFDLDTVMKLGKRDDMGSKAYNRTELEEVQTEEEHYMKARREVGAFNLVQKEDDAILPQTAMTPLQPLQQEASTRIAETNEIEVPIEPVQSLKPVESVQPHSSATEAGG